MVRSVVGGLCSPLRSVAYFFRLFIVAKDITLNRFWKTFKICGSVPRQFLHAVESRKARKNVRTQISAAIQKGLNIKEVVNGIVGDKVTPHRAFVVYPSDKDRILDGCFVKAISEGAIKTIIRALDERSADAAFDLYESTRGSSIAAPLRGNLFEHKVHRYLPRDARSFILRSLDGAPAGQLDLPKGMVYSVFGPPQVLSGKIADCADARQIGYFQPISDNFASLDAIIHQPDGPLIGIQVTNTATHPINTKGLKALQSLLSETNDTLSPLRPTPEDPWIILYVVPTPMEASFTKQKIKGDASATWSTKTAQYVLGLDEHEVFRAHLSDEEESDSDEEESENERQ